jgi:hypothetical protein
MEFTIPKPISQFYLSGNFQRHRQLSGGGVLFHVQNRGLVNDFRFPDLTSDFQERNKGKMFPWIKGIPVCINYKKDWASLFLIYTYIPKQTVHIGLTLLSLKGIVQPKKKKGQEWYQSIGLAVITQSPMFFRYT